jgi:hypothetical protein
MVRFGPRLIPECSRISRFYFGPDIRDAASPDFIGPEFCVTNYPLRDYIAMIFNGLSLMAAKKTL